MFDFLFNQQEVIRLYGNEEFQRGIEIGLQMGIKKGAHSADFESAKRLIQAKKISFDEICDFYPSLLPDDIEKLKEETKL